MTHILPELPYDYKALEPIIDAQTMEIHHTKHHQGYVDKLNKALEGYDELQDRPVEELLADLEAIPADIRTAVQNSGGGHANHSLFWEIMAPGGKGEPDAELSEAISAAFGNLETLKQKFNEAATGVFGSGWAWLVVNMDNELEVVSTPNQDTPISSGKLPILTLDVWEHAYYLKYQNKRPDYINGWWEVVNWEQVNENFKNAKA